MILHFLLRARTRETQKPSRWLAAAPTRKEQARGGCLNSTHYAPHSAAQRSTAQHSAAQRSTAAQQSTRVRSSWSRRTSRSRAAPGATQQRVGLCLSRLCPLLSLRCCQTGAVGVVSSHRTHLRGPICPLNISLFVPCTVRRTLWQGLCPLSLVPCPLSLVPCPLSPVPCPLSRVL